MIKKKYIDLLFASAFSISFVLHLLIVLMIYHPGNFISLPMTAGMLLSWFYTSNVIKNLPSSETEGIAYKNILSKLPQNYRYLLLFLSFYAAINFIITLSVSNGTGWVDLNPDHDKLRGMSGFWLLFYALGFTAAYLDKKSK